MICFLLLKPPQLNCWELGSGLSCLGFIPEGVGPAPGTVGNFLCPRDTRQSIARTVRGLQGPSRAGCPVGNEDSPGCNYKIKQQPWKTVASQAGFGFPHKYVGGVFVLLFQLMATGILPVCCVRYVSAHLTFLTRLFLLPLTRNILKKQLNKP